MPNLRILSMLLPLVMLAGCSLMELSLEGDSEPLSKTAINTRLLVRAFHDDFTNQVVIVADSIRKMSQDIEVQKKAIQWKINTNKASAKAAFQSIPEIALVDTWILCSQMDTYFKTDAGSVVFNEASPLAVQAARGLNERIEKTARVLYPKKRFDQLASFVSDYTVKHPFTSLEFPRQNILNELTRHLNVADTTYITTLGSGSQAMSDLSDRIGVFREQLQLQLEWQKELISLNWENDSIADSYLARADSLSVSLGQLATIARESPETMALIAENMRMELLPIVSRFNEGIEGSIMRFSEERRLLQKFIDEQRVLAVGDMNSSGKALIVETGQSMTEVVKEVSWLLIVLTVILALVFGGIPFVAGYLVAKARFKEK